MFEIVRVSDAFSGGSNSDCILDQNWDFALSDWKASTGRSHGSAEILNSSVRNELQMPKSMMRVFISAANLILIEMMLGEEGETSLLVHNRSTAEYFITRSPLCGKSLRPTKV